MHVRLLKHPKSMGAKDSVYRGWRWTLDYESVETLGREGEEWDVRKKENVKGEGTNKEGKGKEIEGKIKQKALFQTYAN